jgi:hypothetical protein
LANQTSANKGDSIHTATVFFLFATGCAVLRAAGCAVFFAAGFPFFAAGCAVFFGAAFPFFFLFEKVFLREFTCFNRPMPLESVLLVFVGAKFGAVFPLLSLIGKHFEGSGNFIA